MEERQLTKAAEAAVEKVMAGRPALPEKKEIFATKKSWWRKFLGIPQKKVLLSFVPFWEETGLYRSRYRLQGWKVSGGKLVIRFPIGLEVKEKEKPVQIMEYGKRRFEEREVYDTHFPSVEVEGPEVFPLTSQQASWLAGENRPPSWGTADDMEKVKKGPVSWTMRDADPWLQLNVG